MDLTQNRIPEEVRTIHLIAICGTGMGALAGMLNEAGFEVTGSDHHVYPPMSTFLAERGIQIAERFRPENLSRRPDLVVVGNAVSKDNPEVVGMFEMGLPFCSFPQALNRFFIHGKGALTVTGTHGKTTTAALLAWVLAYAGLDPGFMVGGILKNFDSNYNIGTGPYFVVEGDEYDTAFFDKGPKFLHFTPSRAILTSVEFDHADIYTDLDHVKKAFLDFVTTMPEEALLVACDGAPSVRDLVAQAKCWVAAYGFEERSPWRLEDVRFDPPWTYLEVTSRGEPFGTFKTPLPGLHNALNALSVIAVAHDMRLPQEVISGALETFEGIKRRQEVRGVKKGITVIDDFAHHPTEVRETLAAIRAFHVDNRIIAVFEPRTNSSMRKVFQKVYPDSFDDADLVCIRKPPLLEKIPADERFSSEELVEDLKNGGKKAFYFPDTDAIIDYLVNVAVPEDIILIMSNGGFDNIHERLLERL
ncbi:MAG: UDP-N-acetylmuramate:L-alanyl-gamma-D-glutamyl-meso-diaminopimelate ligase [Deltaproteobacteria bacterium]|nr:UDP-N-acetylmuramate:L-alanyl-gamma-D-glutamyl-meso-diaminopimelate ligase [Deltaproteobacteria bacterium]MBW2258949.1 UDP-N-acetylmuramate:L-alanyl-gamma-D-glutamyl-meso-diaminopimelate ligase [Deltaproteobacteria bacterium]